MELHSDQGRNFESAVFREMCYLMGITKTQTTPLHPQSDGMVERMNRTLLAQLALFTEDHQRDWDCHIPLLLMALRSAVQECTGCTAAQLMIGQVLRLPVDLSCGRPENERNGSHTLYMETLHDSLQQALEFARTHLKLASDRMKCFYDVHSSRDLLSRGDAVWLYNP